MEGWPQTAEAWRLAIERGLDISQEQARQAFSAGQFDFAALETWLQSEFGEGYHPDFAPALIRNQRALVAWAYGAGEEPYWPGSDIDGQTESSATF
jgi:hypothetical protein